MISLPTILVCTGISTFIVALGLSGFLAVDRRNPATSWWCASMWTVTAGTCILATRAVSPPWFSIGFGNLATIVGFALAWAGFASFSQRWHHWLAVAIGPIIWAYMYFGVEAFRSDVNARLIFVSVIFAVYSILIVESAWHGWRKEPLPSYIATMSFLGIYFIFYCVRVGAALLYPATEVNGEIQAPWIVYIALQGFALTVVCAFLFLALIKERAERRYRLASEVDGLTSAYSRGHFVSEARKLLQRQPRSSAMAVLDLDHFKKINDTHGHMAGDAVLRHFSELVAGRLSDTMVFGRLGGEEFGLFISGMGEAEACEFIEGVRKAVEEMTIAFNGQLLKVTTSIGIAGTEEVGHELDHLMAAADNALYASKDAGRNCVTRFSPSIRLKKILEDTGESRVSLASDRISRISVRNTRQP